MPQVVKDKLNIAMLGAAVIIGTIKREEFTRTEQGSRPMFGL